MPCSECACVWGQQASLLSGCGACLDLPYVCPDLAACRLSSRAQVKVVLTKGYVPKFNAAFEHFLLHTGGRAVIDEMEEKLSLTAKQVQPSKDALYRFGNTSAASTWCAQTRAD